MGIPDEDVARVRAETDIVSLIGEHAALKRVGQRWQGLCPFHGEKTPSFSVNAEEGFYYCFGCLAKGDAISFVRAMEHLDFVDAVRRLADRAGITIREDAASGRDSQRRKVFLDAMERATEWYHQRLLTSPDAMFGDRDSVSWKEVGQVPLCLLTPDMQNRRIIDALLRSAGQEPSPTLESNSMIVLYSHVRTGRWASVMPARLAATLGLTDVLRAIPIVEPEASHAIGLVVPARQPMKPLTAALVIEARRAAQLLAD